MHGERGGGGGTYEDATNRRACIFNVTQCTSSRPYTSASASSCVKAHFSRTARALLPVRANSSTRACLSDRAFANFPFRIPIRNTHASHVADLQAKVSCKGRGTRVGCCTLPHTQVLRRRGFAVGRLAEPARQAGHCILEHLFHDLLRSQWNTDLPSHRKVRREREGGKCGWGEREREREAMARKGNVCVYVNVLSLMRIAESVEMVFTTGACP